MPILDKIEEIVNPLIEAEGAFLLDVEIHGSKKGKTIEVFIDNDSGITTEICASVSRAISKKLDSENLFPGRYYLVVSSPGTDRPLKFPRQYQKHVGRTLSLRLGQGPESRKLEGKLSGVTADGIVLQFSDGSSSSVQFTEIREARVIASL